MMNKGIKTDYFASLFTTTSASQLDDIRTIAIFSFLHVSYSA